MYSFCAALLALSVYYVLLLLLSLCVSSGTGRRCGLRAGAGLRVAALAGR